MCADAVKADPVDVDLLFLRQQLWRDDVFKSKQNLKAGDVAVTIAVLLQRQTTTTTPTTIIISIIS